MAQRWRSKGWRLGLANYWAFAGALAQLAVGVIFSENDAFAQIKPDATLGTERSVVTSLDPDFRVDVIDGGTKRGANLFHSFREFNVDKERGAYFTNPVGIENILSRVTGKNRSDIQGTLGVLGKANLFLINPNGIIFGPRASLDVRGSFVATTANAIQFDQQGFFSASAPDAPPLLTVNPSAFLFNQIAHGSIDNNSIAPAGVDPSETLNTFGLRVPDGQSLLLLGGDITMNIGGLYAFGGQVELGGITGAGTVGLNGGGNNLSLSFPDSVERSDVSLTNGAGVDVTASDGGSIAVNARNLEMRGGSFLLAGIGSGLGSDNSQADNIEVNATGTINLNNSFIHNQVLRKANGQGGDVNISTSTLLVQDGAQVSANTFGKGKGGNLTVDAQDVQLIGASADNPSGLFVPTLPSSTGDAGDLTLNTKTLLVKDGAQVSAGTFGKGKGGNLTVNAQDVQIIGTGADPRVASGLDASAGSDSSNLTGDAGDLTLITKTLLVKDGARVITTTFGKGNGGNLTVNAQDVQIIGESSEGGAASRLDASAEENSTGDAGDLTLITKTLLVKDGANVSTGTFGKGKGGNLTVNAQGVQLIGTSVDPWFPSSLAASAQPDSTGDAGNLTINTNSLLVKDGAQVFTGTFGEGKGGNLTINAQDVQLIGESADGLLSSSLAASASLPASAGSNLTQPNSIGNAGNLTINTNTLLVKDGAQVSTATSGKGKGGDLTIDAQEVQLIGSLLAASAEENSIGNAGNLTLITKTLLVQDGAVVKTTTSGKGKGGNLAVTASDFVELIGGGGLFAQTEGAEDAGDLTIDTGRLSVRHGAAVSAATIGAGDAGSISVQADEAVSLENSYFFSTVEAGAVGNGGIIDIQAESLSLTDGAQLGTFVREASETLPAGRGNAGNVTINVQDAIKIAGVDSEGYLSGIFSQVETGAKGKGGNITLKAGSLSLTDGARVDASTFGKGNAGSISVQADDSVSLSDSSYIFSTVGAGAVGNGGIINIQAGSLSLTDGAQLGTFVREAFEILPAGQGNAGNVTINVQDAVKIAGVDSEEYPSGIFSNVETGAKGKGGNITLKAESLAVIDSAELSAGSDGSGTAGNLYIEAGSIRLDNKAVLSSDTTSGQGNIILDSEDLVLRRGSNISTDATGTATGGNITIDTGVMAALENSDIRANASEGPGGRVTINAQGIFGTEFREAETPQSDITATSELGPQFSGTVEISTPDVDPSQGLVALPEEVVDASGLIAQGCVADEGPFASRLYCYWTRGLTA